MRRYDAVVVGGGIQGTGVAQAIAAAGNSVLLLERRGLASGTSSRSSKLIHGGLRYLETGEFSLVRECLNERKLLLRNAPDLVRMQRFILPIYRQTRRRPWQIRIGLTLYAALAGFRRQAGFGTLPRSRWGGLDGLTTDNLQRVFYYADAQTDDVLLTRAVMRSARELGAELAMPAEFTAARLIRSGCEIDYLVADRQRTCQASVLINAAGPWVNAVADRVTPTPQRHAVALVQGTHLVVDGKLSEGIYYTESPRDGRAIFVMPWYGRTMIGTTETRHRGAAQDAAPTEAEKHYLLSVLRHYFPRYSDVSRDDIVRAFAGLRVLPGGGGHAFHKTREVIYAADRPNLPRYLAIYGGKLTAYRATAQDALERITASMPDRPARGDTRSLALRAD